MPTDADLFQDRPKRIAPYKDLVVCGNCVFYETYLEPDGRPLAKGACRRWPPKSVTRFPGVSNKDWCGEFQVDSPPIDALPTASVAVALDRGVK